MKLGINREKEACKEALIECDDQLIGQVESLKNHLKKYHNIEAEEDFFPQLIMAVYALGIGRGLNQAVLANSNNYDADKMNVDMISLSKELNLSESVVRELKEL